MVRSSSRAWSLGLAFGLALLVGLTALPAWAADTIGVQGRLTTPGGAPAADGAYVMTFRLYDAVDAPAAFWSETQLSVQVSGGLFDVSVGAADPLKPLPLDQLAKLAAVDGKTAFVGVQVGPDPELPRKPLSAVWLAHRASVAVTSLGLSCTGCVTLDNLAPGLLTGVAKTAEANAFTEANAFFGGVGVGQAPGPGCMLDVGSDGGTTCIDGVPALWTRIVGSKNEMLKLAADGQLVYRKDEKKAYMNTGGAWRQLLFAIVCGDGVADGDEECDDGELNADAPDACRTTCLNPACGDGIQDSGEECDDGNNSDFDGCTALCKVNLCGDGNLQQGVEECDDGNGDNTDACVQGCKDAKCGDGFVQAGVEQCDDANADNTDACVGCQDAVCGDGFVQAGVEECDDGQANADAPDACRLSCKNPVCGDGITDNGEQCDDGNQVDGDACKNDCTSNGQVPGYNGPDAPVMPGWAVCAGYLDKPGGNDVPQAWGGACSNAEYKNTHTRLVCGANKDSYRYIEINKNFWADKAPQYQNGGHIIAANFSGYDNTIYVDNNDPNSATSWWAGGSGCGESNTNLTINNSCSWEASNCFGQNIGGNRYLWLYVKTP